MIRSYGYAPFLLVYFCLAGLVVCQNAPHFMALARTTTWAVLLLFLGWYFLAYFALYAWYTPIVSGNRLVLGLFLPAMLCLVWVFDNASKNDLCFRVWGRQIRASAASPFILIALAVYVLLIFPDQISRIPGGH